MELYSLEGIDSLGYNLGNTPTTPINRNLNVDFGLDDKAITLLETDKALRDRTSGDPNINENNIADYLSALNQATSTLANRSPSGVSTQDIDQASNALIDFSAQTQQIRAQERQAAAERERKMKSTKTMMYMTGGLAIVLGFILFPPSKLLKKKKKGQPLNGVEKVIV